MNRKTFGVSLLLHNAQDKFQVIRKLIKFRILRTKLLPLLPIDRLRLFIKVPRLPRKTSKQQAYRRQNINFALPLHALFGTLRHNFTFYGERKHLTTKVSFSF